MPNPIQRAVSKKKRRFVADGFDLDLTRITSKVIAMGFPAQKIESLYRNSLHDVIAFFKKYHPDHYYIVNLCSEREYPSRVFEDRVLRVPFDDHNPPRFEQILPFVSFAKEWLQRDPENVLAVHCKAGKGRTGVMICCLLIYLNEMPDADRALSLYDSRRTSNNKGVTIPSQRRYVYYFSHLLNNQLTYRPTVVRLSGIIVRNLTGPMALGVTCSMPAANRSIKKTFAFKDGERNAVIAINEMVALSGDVRIEFFNRSSWKKAKLFHCWINTFFLHHAPPFEPEGPGAVEVVRPVHRSAKGEDTPCPLHAFIVTLTRGELDAVNKEIASGDLEVVLHFSCIDDSCTSCSKDRCSYWDVSRQCSLDSSSPSAAHPIQSPGANSVASLGLGSNDFLGHHLLTESASMPNSTFAIDCRFGSLRGEHDANSNSSPDSPSWPHIRCSGAQRRLNMIARHTFLVSNSSDDDAEVDSDYEEDDDDEEEEGVAAVTVSPPSWV